MTFQILTDLGEFLWTSKSYVYTLASPLVQEYYRWIHSTFANPIQNPNKGRDYSINVTIPCAIFIDLNIDLISFRRGKRQSFSVARQHLSDFISEFSTGDSTCLSFTARTGKLSEFLSAVRTYQQLYKFMSPYSTNLQSLSDFFVMSVQYQYLSNFVREKGESQYFSDPVV